MSLVRMCGAHTRKTNRASEKCVRESCYTRREQSKEGEREREKAAALNPKVTLHCCRLRLYSSNLVHERTVSLCVYLCTCFCLYSPHVQAGVSLTTAAAAAGAAGSTRRKQRETKRETRAGVLAFPFMRMCTPRAPQQLIRSYVDGVNRAKAPITDQGERGRERRRGGKHTQQSKPPTASKTKRDGKRTDQVTYMTEKKDGGMKSTRKGILGRGERGSGNRIASR